MFECLGTEDRPSSLSVLKASSPQNNSKHWNCQDGLQLTDSTWANRTAILLFKLIPRTFFVSKQFRSPPLAFRVGAHSYRHLRLNHKNEKTALLQLRKKWIVCSHSNQLPLGTSFKPFQLWQLTSTYTFGKAAVHSGGLLLQVSQQGDRRSVRASEGDQSITGSHRWHHQ